MNTNPVKGMEYGGDQPRPGHRITGAGSEVYDVTAHIQRAFEGMPIGKYLRSADILQRGMRDDIPESKSLSSGPLRERLRAGLHERPAIEGIVVDYDDNARLIAYKKGSVPVEQSEHSPTFDNLRNAVQAGDNERAKAILMSGDAGLAAEINAALFPPDSIHNPVVECCDRDAADCDCDPLRQEYVKVRKELGDRAEEIEDRARELAIAIIVTGGFDEDDSDLLGDRMGDTVQTHLMLAFMRQADMLDHHEEAHSIGPDYENGQFRGDSPENLYSEMPPDYTPGTMRDMLKDS